MEDFIGVIIFLAIGIISAISKSREKADSPLPSFPRKKTTPQKLNRRPLSAGTSQARKLDNAFQKNLEKPEPQTPLPDHDEHAVFEHEHNYEEEKLEATNHSAATVDYGHSRAAHFAHFIKAEGKNAIVVSEILGKPKGWE